MYCMKIEGSWFRTTSEQPGVYKIMPYHPPGSESVNISFSFPYRTRSNHTVCPSSSDPFDIVTYYVKTGHYFLDKQ